MKHDEFYIGWMPKAPPSFSKQIKKVVLVLVAITILTATILSLAQMPFGTGNFEFGKLTEVKGIYFEGPVPMLKVINGKTIFGKLNYITIPLIGYGKHGAETAISEVEKEKNIALNKREVTMKGTLLYNDGKLLMQVDVNDNFLVSTGNIADASLMPEIKIMGDQSFAGEIVDPKCFFGVMKPGHGKPHKDCAIRCILGGIPPVLHVADESGKENYYLIVGANGEKMNEAVKDFVAEPVTLQATVERYDDWIILHVNQNSLKRYSYIESHFGNTIASCGTACSR